MWLTGARAVRLLRGVTGPLVDRQLGEEAALAGLGHGGSWGGSGDHSGGWGGGSRGEWGGIGRGEWGDIGRSEWGGGSWHGGSSGGFGWGGGSWGGGSGGGGWGRGGSGSWGSGTWGGSGSSVGRDVHAGVVGQIPTTTAAPTFFAPRLTAVNGALDPNAAKAGFEGSMDLEEDEGQGQLGGDGTTATGGVDGGAAPMAGPGAGAASTPASAPPPAAAPAPAPAPVPRPSGAKAVGGNDSDA
jgi:hypothetical protein